MAISPDESSRFARRSTESWERSIEIAERKIKEAQKELENARYWQAYWVERTRILESLGQ